MKNRRYFFRFLALFFASFLSSSAFGTLTNFEAKSLNAPNPLGFRSGVSATSFLLLNAHETTIADRGEFPIRQTLSDHSLEQRKEPICVVPLAEIESPSFFVAVPMQVGRSDSNVGSLQCSLQQGPEVFHAVRVATCPNVFDSMINRTVSEPIAKRVVRQCRVGIDMRVSLDVADDVASEVFGISGGNDECPDVSTPFDDPLDGSLIDRSPALDLLLSLFGVHVFRTSANKCFVRFDFASHLPKVIGFHRQANPMQHEPSGLLSDAQCPAKLVGTDSVLAVCDRPDGHEPLVETERAILEDCPDLVRELALASPRIALQLRSTFDRCNRLATAFRTDDLAIWPLQITHTFVAACWIGKVSNGIDQSFWKVRHSSPPKNLDTSRHIHRASVCRSIPSRPHINLRKLIQSPASTPILSPPTQEHNRQAADCHRDPPNGMVGQRRQRMAEEPHEACYLLPPVDGFHWPLRQTCHYSFQCLSSCPCQTQAFRDSLVDVLLNCPLPVLETLRLCTTLASTNVLRIWLSDVQKMIRRLWQHQTAVGASNSARTWKQPATVDRQHFHAKPPFALAMAERTFASLFWLGSHPA